MGVLLLHDNARLYIAKAPKRTIVKLNFMIINIHHTSQIWPQLISTFLERLKRIWVICIFRTMTRKNRMYVFLVLREGKRILYK